MSTAAEAPEPAWQRTSVPADQLVVAHSFSPIAAVGVETAAKLRPNRVSVLPPDVAMLLGMSYEIIGESYVNVFKLRVPTTALTVTVATLAAAAGARPATTSSCVRHKTVDTLVQDEVPHSN